MKEIFENIVMTASQGALIACDSVEKFDGYENFEVWGCAVVFVLSNPAGDVFVISNTNPPDDPANWGETMHRLADQMIADSAIQKGDSV